MVLNVKDFPDDLHRQAKIQAAIEGISLKGLIIKALSEYLKKKKGGWFYGNHLQERPDILGQVLPQR